MTHHELTRADRAGRASPCPGELAELGNWPDTVWRCGRARVRSVTLYHCRDCGMMIPYDADALLVLNAYTPVDATRVIADLADALDAGREPS